MAVAIQQANQPVNVKILRNCRVGDRDKRGFPKSRRKGEVCILPWNLAIIVVGSKKAEFTDEKPHPPPEATFKAAENLTAPARQPIPSRK